MYVCGSVCLLLTCSVYVYVNVSVSVCFSLLLARCVCLYVQCFLQANKTQTARVSNLDRIKVSTLSRISMELLSKHSLLLRSTLFASLLISASAMSPRDPPPGNSPFLRVIGEGVQIYRCEKTRGRLKYVFDEARARLYSADDLNVSSPALGSHYFLPRQDAGGGRATWSIITRTEDNSWSTPSSTATFRVIQKDASHAEKSIDSLLLRATSHSGDGPLSQASYAQRLNSTGGLSPCFCSEAGEILEVPYRSHYVFWIQKRDSPEPPLIPQNLALPEPGHILLISYFAQGFLMYESTGTSWELRNLSAVISSQPGDPVLGRHDFLPRKDSGGGQLSWSVFSPASRVTVKILRKEKKGRDSIPWSLLQATSHAGETPYFLGSVSYVQCLFTTGGLPPRSSAAMATENGRSFHRSEYSAIYFFYVPRSEKKE